MHSGKKDREWARRKAEKEEYGIGARLLVKRGIDELRLGSRARHRHRRGFFL
jgi:hypothetical protein